MRGNGIIAGVMALCVEFEQTFACLEADLNLPPQAIDFENTFLIRNGIGADKADPVLLISVFSSRDEFHLHFAQKR